MVKKDKIELLGIGISELEEFVTSLGEARFRGRQIHKWIYQKDEDSFYAMSDLPKELRAKLDEVAIISFPKVLKQRVSKDGTRKYLLEFPDKKRVETVLIPQRNDNEKDIRYSLCLSTQVGCPVGCAFCATGLNGFQRNLTAGEIVGEFLSSRRELKKKVKLKHEQPISNVVYMGMGEPMFNYDEVIKSIYILNDHKGINIGQRSITISTSGDVKGIEKLALENLQVTLAVSLHACDNELRDKLVPINRKYPLESLFKAVEFYIAQTNRRVTFEYVMLDDVNISRKDADNMIKLVKPLLANVNLIPYNEVEGLPYQKPAKDKILQFYNWLVEGGLNVTIREEKGADIEAACGQLQAKR
ncbi:23S rRNA (adenine(2503)-C(2))-methyltransferase RlmN [Thermosyntropha sp.]|uniref:23S rRNA (adenine(2503)-C(2))-methyltransferase RlmN n=1 Tax=Thermosyntropha sp. TaxID=2740820 RepID=UPI0025D16BAF|nr:23S rRNA (adenine(2503)-C(2))-methyltransferase RlmN [Thermosyntropha sp.]MBO8158514.1 23S rRNA (adenine(2503)-C(2))-methyltransferase RlmN [Thermosyntropha sp.]